MFYKNYSFAQLENMANEMNRKYDSDRLTIPKQPDVYDLVDLLGARLAFEYLSPDRTYLGITLFCSGTLYVWPGNPYKDWMIPTEKYFYGGTIVIDRDLNESQKEEDHFTENFTVIHECFHFDKHQETFKYSGLMPKSFSSYRENQADKSSVLYQIERQANYFAAAFLMPRKATLIAAKELLRYNNDKLNFGYGIKPAIKKMGRLFGVNYSPMVYRLQEIGILDHQFNPYL